MLKPNALLLAISVLLLSCSHADVQPSHQASRQASGQVSGQLLEGESETNRLPDAPYVVLVSIDGYRWDFNRIFQPPALTKLAAEGAAAEALLPIYPSKTFPNHYSIATGLYANHHGIVSNEFYDPARRSVFSLPDRSAVEDGTWYGGEPLWVSIRKQGLLTASYFWVGSDAEIKGHRPNYYYHYDAAVPEMTRAEQVVRWLELPESRRPHFITLYFDGVDLAGHHHGVKSPETAAAISRVDAAIAKLRDGIANTGLPVNIIIVSDHGLADLERDREVVLDETPEMARLLKKFRTQGRGPQMLLYLNPGEDRSVLNELRKTMKRDVRGAHLLENQELRDLHYDQNSRTGDLVVSPDADVLIGLKGQMPKKAGANHGWNPAYNKDMHGVVFATGPGFKSGARVKAFENVNIYPLVMRLLGLPITVPIDGDLAATKNMLKAP